jgi:hypothetical protein
MKIGSIEINLFTDKGYNNPNITERMIEIPLARWFIKQHNNYIIEVGAVTPYYDTINHEVIDPYDNWPGCMRIGAKDYPYENKNVLSISTIEHIGHGEYSQPKNPKDAQEVLERIRKASSYLVTWPVGYHTELDAYVADAKDLLLLKRINFQEWEIVKTLEGVRYMYPWVCGNGLCIITNCNELI